MGPIKHIRTKVFGVSQEAFANFAGVKQATVSRWENGEFEPGRNELDRIRREAQARGIDWDDRWFFEAPPAPAAPPEHTKVSAE